MMKAATSAEPKPNKGTRFPSTFEIAIILSVLVFLMVWMGPRQAEATEPFSVFQLLKFWQKGFWELLEFTMQMILILVLGYALASSSPAQNFLNLLARWADTNTKAVMVTGIVAMVGGYLNWGFGLVVGAILARQIGEVAKARALQINYPLVGAAGYLGMMVWHGGLSASSSLKVAEENHFLADKMGVLPIGDTIFSTTNLLINALVVLGLVALLYLLSKRKADCSPFPATPAQGENPTPSTHGRILGRILGTLIIFLCLADFFRGGYSSLAFFDLNYVNFLLFGLGFLVFGNVEEYFLAIGGGLKASTDILVQFPFYAGILGMMKYSGFLVVASNWFFQNTPANLYPVLAFVSAALVNLFIPSGGWQWAVQGPILMDAGMQLGLKPADLVLAFSYGDQLTNMLQPFWALPLLSITGIAARELLRYTIMFFLVGLLGFILGIFLLM